MKKFVSVLLSSCALAAPLCAWSSNQKILTVDIQKVFENYDKAKAAQAAYAESVSAADKELREMYEELVKISDTVKELQAKADNTNLTDSARNKFKNEANAKLEEMRKKDIEFGQLRKDLNEKLSRRRQNEITEQSKAFEKAVSKVAKAKKADIVLANAIYNDEATDISDLVTEELNSKSKR
ncbi:MAG: OmpH family outer membrane protein [Opitutales bacterium]|nr:OmpH family outer membrane protein [Opitutales bacterium]